MKNFGVELFLKTFLEHGAKPGGRTSNIGEIKPTHPEFSGFVFKLQANMDPKHRDRVAFVRACTGRFEKDMTVNHARTGETVRLSRPQKLFAQDREIIEEAYPGDAIGDTIYTGGNRIKYEGIPCFSPELFAYLRKRYCLITLWV
jgi:peptide chain release factor 3